MKNLNIFKLKLSLLSLFVAVSSCSDSDEGSDILPLSPDTYTFVRNGVSTVSYSGQTTRLDQADELYSALNSDNVTEQNLALMFGGDNGSSAGFANELLNGTTKIIRSKTSAYANSGYNRSIFDGWINEYANDVAPNLGQMASNGQPGILGGYQLNSAGQELDQLFFKSLIGAFALDQIINNYITPSQLDSGTRREDNTNGILEEGKPYTTMEHKWDEGFGYLYGQVDNIELNYGLPAEGESTGNLLMKYFKKVEEIYEPGIAETVYNAFIDGRHAITNADYDARDAAAAVIKTELSKVIGYYSIHYLNDYLVKAAEGQVAKAHHSLSEGYGFMFSLQFTNDGGDQPYMDHSTIDTALNNYFSNFHEQQDVYIVTMPGSANLGMIDQIKDAFGGALNIQ